jgi:flagellar biosynthesis/type III secretory pathway protein FliH
MTPEEAVQLQKALAESLTLGQAEEAAPKTPGQEPTPAPPEKTTTTPVDKGDIQPTPPVTKTAPTGKETEPASAANRFADVRRSREALLKSMEERRIALRKRREARLKELEEQARRAREEALKRRQAHMKEMAALMKQRLAEEEAWRKTMEARIDPAIDNGGRPLLPPTAGGYRGTPGTLPYPAYRPPAYYPPRYPGYPPSREGYPYR